MSTNAGKQLLAAFVLGAALAFVLSPFRTPTTGFKDSSQAAKPSHEPHHLHNTKPAIMLARPRTPSAITAPLKQALFSAVRDSLEDVTTLKQLAELTKNESTTTTTTTTTKLLAPLSSLKSRGVSMSCPSVGLITIQPPLVCLAGAPKFFFGISEELEFTSDDLTTWNQLFGIVLVRTTTRSLLVPEIGQLSLLNFMFFEDSVEGSIPEELWQLTNLSLFTINSCLNVTGSLSSGISNLANLTSLRLTYTGLTGDIPESLFTLTNLRVLDISDNAFTGTLSKKIGQMTSIVVLSILRNLFEGTVPKQCSQLTNLELFELNSNFFEGSLPTQFGLLTKLTRLDASNNLFSGTIPPQLGRLTQLTHLDLLGNRFSGTLPRQLTQLTALNLLDVSRNAVSGLVPLSLFAHGFVCNYTYLDSTKCNLVCPGCVISSFEVHTCGGEAYQPQCIPGYYFIPVIVFVVFFFALALRPISPPNTPRKQFIIEVMVATLSVIDMAMDILFVIKSHKFQMHVSSIAILVLVTCVNFGVCVWVFSQTAQEINVDGSHSKLHFREHVYKRKFKLTLTAVYCSVNLRGLPYIVNKAGESHESIQFGQLGLRSLVGLATVMLEDIPQFILQVESVVSYDKTLIVVLSLTATIISILIECEKIFFDRILRQSTATTVFTSIPTTTTTTAATIASRMRRMSYAVTQMFAFAPTPIAPTPTTTAAAAPTSTQETLTPVATTPASSPTQSHQQQQLPLQQQASEGDTESAVGRVSGELAQEIFLASPRAGHEFELTQLTSSHS